jgi:hypothetical protein
MSPFEELLRNTLKNLNEQLSQAGGDLNRAVAEVDKAVSAISEGTLHLKLRLCGRSVNPLNYELALIFRGEDSRPLVIYEVPLSSYPIGVYEISNVEPRAKIGSIHSEAELTEHFQRIVTDPESSLLGYLAFAVRQLEEDKREAEQATAG